MTEMADLIVTNARVYTCDPGNEWVEAFAVANGKISALGSTESVAAFATSDTEIIDAGGRMVMPGLCDGHAHLGLGGAQVAWELTISPTADVNDILTLVKSRAATLAPNEWVIGSTIGSPVIDELAKGGYLEALDEASAGRPVLLRDDSHHNRWVNSRALELAGIGQQTPDPDEGTYVRDASGKLTGVLYESACAAVEEAAARSIENPAERDIVSLREAVKLLNSFGITAIQDAGTSERDLRALSTLDDSGELTAWVVGSLPARPFFGEEFVGEELFTASRAYRRTHVRPDFAKLFLDGVPMTRTAALLTPYVCHGAHEDPEDTGPLFWTSEELVATLERCRQLGLGAKLHATGDGSVRQALNAIEMIRKEHSDGQIFQIAHVAYIDPTDLPRFAELDVVPDASPYIWFPTPFDESIANQVPAEVLDRNWPFKDLLASGACLTAGSDWPVVPIPSPWIAMETMVTRANPDPSVPGLNNPAQRIDVRDAINAFTRNAARAIGLGDSIGVLATGRSADFLVLNQNLFDIAPNEIHQTQVEYTYFEGRRIYDHSVA
ncbi:amidohydrolase family protein [Nocardia sp. R7R-8]|uniref:amidohydrolase family protein n=1 Tax=Nocardia sp. R7R-8 TaxID=3459304 RepID=UPI00403D615F